VSPAGATTVRTLDGPSLATRSAPVAGALFLGAASFTFGAILVHLHPALYWADGYGRTVGRDHILLDRWLPLLQVVVYGTGKLTRNVETLRLVLAFIGAFTVASAVALGASLARYSVGVVFALLLATNLLFVALSIVPYQEVLFAGLLFAALSLHTSPAGTRSPWLAAAAFNLACLTRYEGWVLVLVLGLDDFVEVARHDGLARGLRSSLGLTVRYGLAAVGWLLLLRALGGGVGRLSGAPSNDPAGLVLRGREFLRECDWQVAPRPVRSSRDTRARPIVVGERTFGKWSLQTLDDLGNGYAAKYTISLLRTPSGETYDGVGVSPDVQVDLDHKTYLAAEHQPELATRIATDSQLRTAATMVHAR